MHRLREVEKVSHVLHVDNSNVKKLFVKFVCLKKILERSACNAVNAVSAEELSMNDLHSLAKEIIKTLIDPAMSFPNQSVLTLINITYLMVALEEREITSVNSVLLRIAPNDKLTWEDSIKILRRSFLIRNMRNLAHKVQLGAPLKLNIPKFAADLCVSQENNKLFRFDKMEFGKGSKACIQLLNWVKSLFTINNKQISLEEKRNVNKIGNLRIYFM